ncbi:hypothetical protein ACVINZ_000569 [Mesorhizobium jarvisii]
MKNTCEIVFIDPSVADIPTLIAGLRPSVQPVLLSGSMPASEEIARALHDRESLDAIHIVVHGRSGELSFSTGALSLANVDRHSDDLAAIGHALGPDGDLLLWGLQHRRRRPWAGICRRAVARDRRARRGGDGSRRCRGARRKVGIGYAVSSRHGPAAADSGGRWSV